MAVPRPCRQCLSAGALAVAQDKYVPASTAASTDGNQTQDIAALRAMIAAQQKQLDALKDALDKPTEGVG